MKSEESSLICDEEEVISEDAYALFLQAAEDGNRNACKPYLMGLYGQFVIKDSEPLRQACKAGKLGVASLLIEYNFNIYEPGSDGQNALNHAFEQNHQINILLNMVRSTQFKPSDEQTLSAIIETALADELNEALWEKIKVLFIEGAQAFFYNSGNESIEMMIPDSQVGEWIRSWPALTEKLAQVDTKHPLFRNLDLLSGRCHQLQNAGVPVPEKVLSNMSLLEDALREVRIRPTQAWTPGYHGGMAALQHSSSDDEQYLSFSDEDYEDCFDDSGELEEALRKAQSEGLKPF